MMNTNFMTFKNVELLAKEVKSTALHQTATLLKEAELSNSHFISNIARHSLKLDIIDTAIPGSLLLSKTNLRNMLDSLSKFDALSIKWFVEDIEEMKSKCVRDFSFLTDQSNEDALKNLIEACKEFTQMEFHSFTNKTSESQISTRLFDTPLSFSSRYDAIAGLQGKPWGFYLATLIDEDGDACVNPHYNKVKCIISKQTSGVYFSMFSTTTSSAGDLKCTPLMKNPFFDDRRTLNSTGILNPDEKKTISNEYSQDFLFKLSLLISLVADNHHIKFDMASVTPLIAFGERKASTALSTLVEDSVKAPAFQPKQLRYEGDFECLSFLDDLFECHLYTNLSLINFQTDSSNDIAHYLSIRLDNNRAVNITDIEVNQAHVRKENSFLYGSNTIVKPFPKCMHISGVSENRLRDIALFNKNAVYSRYIRYLITEIFDIACQQLEHKLQACANDMLPMIIEKYDPESAIYEYGVSAKNNNLISASDIVFISQKPEQKNDISSIRTVNQKAKAHKVMGFNINSIELLLDLISCLGENVMQLELTFILNCMRADAELKKLSVEKNYPTKLAYQYNFKTSPPEMLMWHNVRSLSIEILVPVSKAEYLQLKQSHIVLNR